MILKDIIPDSATVHQMFTDKNDQLGKETHMAIDSDAFEFNQLERESALTALQAKREELKEAGYDDPDIYKELQEERDMLAYRATDEEFEAITKGLNLEPPLEPDPSPDCVRQLKQAIADKDVETLWKSVDILADLKKLSKVSYGATMGDIKERFGKAVNLHDLKAAVNQAYHNLELAERGETQDVATVAYNWSMGHRDMWAYDEQQQCWRMYNGSYWQVEVDKGGFLDQYAITALQEAGLAVNSSQALGLFQRVAISHCKRKFVHAPNRINFDNATLDLDTMRLVNYDPADNFTYCLAHSYDERGVHPTIDNFLYGSVGDMRDLQFVPNKHAIQAIETHVGLAMMEDDSLHKALMGLGAPGSGKSTLLQLCNMACGLNPKNYVSDTIFQRDLEGAHARYTFNDRIIACIDEVPADALQEEELFKQIVGHSGVSMRGFYKGQEIENEWKPQILMVANDDPHYKDISGAIKRRLIIFRMPVKRSDEPVEGMPSMDNLLLEKMESELGAWAATCIRRAKVVRARGFYPQSASQKKDLDQVSLLGNPLKRFVNEQCIVGNREDQIFSSALYPVYKEFVLSMGNSPLAENKLTTSLKNMALPIDVKHTKKGNKIIGLRLRTTDDDPFESYDGEDEDDGGYKDSPLTDEGEGSEGRVKAKNNSLHRHELAIEAPSDDMVKAVKADWQKTPYTEKMSVSDESDTYVSYRELFPAKKPSLPSPNPVNGHVEPNQAGEGTKNQPSPCLHYLHPSKEQINGALHKLDELAAMWSNDKGKLTVQWKHQFGNWQTGDRPSPRVWQQRAVTVLMSEDKRALGIKAALVEEINQRHDKM